MTVSSRLALRRTEKRTLCILLNNSKRTITRQKRDRDTHSALYERLCLAFSGYRALQVVRVEITGPTVYSCVYCWTRGGATIKITDNPINDNKAPRIFNATGLTGLKQSLRWWGGCDSCITSAILTTYAIFNVGPFGDPIVATPYSVCSCRMLTEHRYTLFS